MEKKNFAYVLLGVGLCLILAAGYFRYDFNIFTNEGFLGNGTEEDPYLIDDFSGNITIENSNGVYLLENRSVNSIYLDFFNVSKVYISNMKFENTTFSFLNTEVVIFNSQFKNSSITASNSVTNISSCEFLLFSTLWFEGEVYVNNSLFMDNERGIILNDAISYISNSMFCFLDTGISVSNSQLNLTNNTFVDSAPIEFAISQIEETGRVVLDDLIEIPRSIMGKIEEYTIEWNWHVRLLNFFDISITESKILIFEALNETTYNFTSNESKSEYLRFETILKTPFNYSLSFDNSLITQNTLPSLEFGGNSYKIFSDYLVFDIEIDDPDIKNGSLEIQDENGVKYLNDPINEDGIKHINLTLPTFQNWTELIITFNDGFGEEIQQSFHVIYSNAYSFSCEFLEDSTDFTVNITAMGLVNGTFELFRNETLVQEGEWYEGSILSFDESVIQNGYNFFKIILTDNLTLKNAFDSIHIMKSDSNIIKRHQNLNPVLKEPNLKTSLNYGDLLEISIEDEIYREFYLSISNKDIHYEVFSSNKSHLFNITNSGEYYIIIEDGIGGYLEKTINVTIINSGPLVDILQIDDLIKFNVSDEQYLQPTWSISLISFRNSSSIENYQDLVVANGEWSNETISFNCSEVCDSFGNYTFVLEVFDGQMMTSIIFSHEVIDTESQEKTVETILFISGGTLIGIGSVAGVVAWRKQKGH